MHPLQDLTMKRTRRRPPIFHREIVRVAGAMLASLLILCLTTTASAAECASWCSRDGHGQSHCAHPDCSSCPLCSSTASCEPTRAAALFVSSVGLGSRA